MPSERASLFLLLYPHWGDTASGKELTQRPIKMLCHAQGSPNNSSSRQFSAEHELTNYVLYYENALGEQNKTSRARESEEEQKVRTKK